MSNEGRLKDTSGYIIQCQHDSRTTLCGDCIARNATHRIIQETGRKDIITQDDLEIIQLRDQLAKVVKAIETVTDRNWYFTGHNDWNDARDILLAALPERQYR